MRPLTRPRLVAVAHDDLEPPGPPSRKSVIAVVPLDAVDERAQAAMTTALSMSASRVIAVHVCDTRESTRAFTRAWERWEPGVPLVLLDRIPSPEDPVAGSLADYLSRRHTAYQVFVVLADNEGRALDDALLPLPNIVVCRQRRVEK